MPDGPVRAEYEQGGGSVVFLSGCVSDAVSGYDWRPPAEPVVTAAAVRQQAERLIPPAALGLAPKHSTLVNIETVIWVDAPTDQDLPAVRSVGQDVRLHLHLASVDYDYGDHTGDPTGSPGTPYSHRHPCRTRLCDRYDGHIYQHTGLMHLHATAHWTVTYTVDGGTRHGLPDTVPGPTADATITVKQARAVLVPNP